MFVHRSSFSAHTLCWMLCKSVFFLCSNGLNIYLLMIGRSITFLSHLRWCLGLSTLCKMNRSLLHALHEIGIQTPPSVCVRVGVLLWVFCCGCFVVCVCVYCCLQRVCVCAVNVFWMWMPSWLCMLVCVCVCVGILCFLVHSLCLTELDVQDAFFVLVVHP